jgi:hypothetical protein
VVRESCHELVALRECCAGLFCSFPDENLHPRKRAPSCYVAGVAQFIHRVAGDVREGVHGQDRSMEALDRIGWAEVVWLCVARHGVLDVALVRHRGSQVRS